VPNNLTATIKKQLSILISAADQETIQFLGTTLNKLQTKGIMPEITVTHSLKEALYTLAHHMMDLIIADLTLPDSQGLNTFMEIQQHAVSTPIIIVGNLTDEQLINDAIKAGAQDYLPKADLTADLLAGMIQRAIERHKLHESLRALSFTDELTNLYNRRGLFTLLEQQMALANRTNKGFYFFLLDLDYLKRINDTHGHLAGDHALIDLAHCLRDSLRQHDIIGRIGGDEFAVIVIHADEGSGEDIKERMFKQVQRFNAKGDVPYQLAFSIGAAYYDGAHTLTTDELVGQADVELYQSKHLSHL
jgi:two-component system, cell cycle response regulator